MSLSNADIVLIVGLCVFFVLITIIGLLYLYVIKLRKSSKKKSPNPEEPKGSSTSGEPNHGIQSEFQDFKLVSVKQNINEKDFSVLLADKSVQKNILENIIEHDSDNDLTIQTFKSDTSVDAYQRSKLDQNPFELETIQKIEDLVDDSVQLLSVKDAEEELKLSNRVAYQFCLNELSHFEKNKNVLIAPCSFITNFVDQDSGDEIKSAPVSDVHRLFSVILKPIRSVQIIRVNKIFCHSDDTQSEANQISSKYLSALEKTLSAQVESIDFAEPESAVREINAQINAHSDGLQASTIDKSLRLVWLNMLHLRPSWLTKFKSRHTRVGSFTQVDGTKVDAHMMHVYGGEFKYAASVCGLAADMLEMLDAEKKLAMCVLLPHEDSSLELVEAALDSHKLNEILNCKEKPRVIEQVDMPYFYMKFNRKETNTVLNVLNSFKDLITTGFGKELVADAQLHDLSRELDSSVCQTYHEVSLEMVHDKSANAPLKYKGNSNNQTDISYALKEMFETGSMQNARKNIYFQCTRPFMFFVHDLESKSVVLAGRYVEPDESSSDLEDCSQTT